MKISIKPMWGHIRWTSTENTLPELLWCENKIALSSLNEDRILVVPTVFFCAQLPRPDRPLSLKRARTTYLHLIIVYLFQNAKFLFKLQSWDLHRPTEIIIALICFVKEVNILKRYTRRFWIKVINVIFKVCLTC